MTSESAFAQIKRLEASLTKLLSQVDTTELEHAARQLTHDIRRDLVDTRLDIRAYEYADTRSEQLQEVQAAKERLQRLQRHILAASLHDMIGPIDVAELSARIDTLLTTLA